MIAITFRGAGAQSGWNLNKAPRGWTYLLIAVDKFTTWIKAKAIVMVTCV
jgi:hypothetical protein